MANFIMLPAIFLLASLASLGSAQDTGNGAAPEQPDCGAPENKASCRQDFQDCPGGLYYSELPADSNEWTREQLADLITRTHRFALPMDGVYEAMMDLDKHPDGGVRLIYSNQNELSTDYGQQDTWTREHLWPDTRGASGLAFYDIHNSRPETTRVTMIRGDMLYGECGTVEYADVCESPAFGAAPTDTSQDGKVWMPPASVRGDIARALFYMALRYGNEDPPLTLSDCPPWQATMGILSQLLEWHEADPVSEEERERNNNACQYWQGNRNPFVDYESLARRFFGEPQELPVGERVYPSCLDIPTPSPTAEANDCNLLEPGDIFVYSVSSDDPDGVGFLALDNIPADVTLYITDYPWNGERFVRQEGEGINKHQVPSSGYEAGTAFGYGYLVGEGFQWRREEGDFNFGVQGDSVMMYCLLGDGSVNPLVAFSNDNEWMDPGLNATDYGATGSAVPEQLADVGSVVLPHLDNYNYAGNMKAEKEVLQAEMMKPENWRGNDEDLGDQSRGVNAANHFLDAALTFLVVALLYYGL